jgi:hypothetical protein
MVPGTPIITGIMFTLLLLLLLLFIQGFRCGNLKEGRRPLGRSESRWEDDVKVDLQEVGGGMDWIDLAQDRDRWQALVNVVMNL